MPDEKRAPLEAAEIKLREIGNILQTVMPPGWGFMMILTSTGEDGFFTYLGNVRRSDGINLLREAATKIEQGKC